MRVLVAGATGAMGQRLVPQLLAGGHEVAAMTRSSEKAEGLRLAGASPVVVDGLDRDVVAAAVGAAEPEVVVHQMTALKGVKNPRKFDAEFRITNELRTRGTDYLLEAARAAGRGGSLRRASRGGRTAARVARSRPRRIRSIRTRRLRCGGRWRRPGTWSRASSPPRVSRGSCSGTERSTGRGRRRPSSWST